MQIPAQFQGTTILSRASDGTPALTSFGATAVVARKIVLSCSGPFNICCSPNGTCCRDCDIVIAASW